MDQVLRRIDQGQMFIICLTFGVGVVSLASWLEEDFMLPYLVPIIILWTILPPICGWKRADLTDNFLASLKRIDIKADDDDCIFCFNACETPVQLPCSHIICEPCLSIILDHHYESCSRCGKNFFGSDKRFFGSGGRWSILISKAVVCGASFVMLAYVQFLYTRCILKQQNSPDETNPLKNFSGWWRIIIVLFCSNFIASAIRSSIHDRHNWWRDLGLYQYETLFNGD